MRAVPPVQGALSCLLPSHWSGSRGTRQLACSLPAAGRTPRQRARGGVPPNGRDTRGTMRVQAPSTRVTNVPGQHTCWYRRWPWLSALMGTLWARRRRTPAEALA
ncbi:hypothetical protein SHJG_0476 [Streptomyces hygroscopicus subsp. jinggangensis 5008]|nr:hypothetical protein SHJG_0476 [Streptomyces hygroscopicus subsp. jinggangensis 5008]AGF59975.1 hypothetical protein SHJGH_0309 [Streptomyces hygroscopicus subsp. jinggangensis TL01]